jgi:acetyl-CoA synthetase
MIAELCFAMLACARIGAAHSVVFGGFSAESIAERCNDAGCKLIITADGGWRRGKVVELKKAVDEAIKLGSPTVEKVLVLERIGSTAEFNRGEWAEGRDFEWEKLVGVQSEVCPCEEMDSEDLLFILYTSGSTGKPKGIMHTTGGYLTGVNATSRWVFDLKPFDIYWCSADCGWITGHSYVVYGPMSNATTVLVYEGAPDTPDLDRFWKIIEKHKVTIFYTAPTAIRSFMKWGTHYPENCDLSSLRLLGSVGEPINPEAWIWYHKWIGWRKCPIVDTWWQTETGNIMISPLPGITTTKPGSACRPLPGIFAEILNEDGKVLTSLSGSIEKPDGAIGGILALSHPWPGMLRGIWGDPERYAKTYWERFEGKYFPGDGVKLDEDGYLFLMGRVDDIMLVAGHNISTMEVESALVDHPGVAEAAVIGKTHDIKGQAICAFVIVKSSYIVTDSLIGDLKAHVAKKIGVVARPDDIILTAELPKTRSGKIMRRLLRDIAEGRALGDTTTLGDPGVVAALKEKYESTES